jgi:hypothetical protein
MKLWATVVLSLACGSAAATEAPRLLADDTAQRTLSCLVPVKGEGPAIAYPEDLLRRQSGGLVRVSLEFTAPDRPPKVRRLFGGADLFDAIEPRVKAYRLPCMAPAAAPIVAIQEFSFDPQGGGPVYPGTTLADASSQGACTLDQSGAGRLQYPREAMLSNREGNVLVHATFDRPGLPSAVKVLNRVGSEHLERHARRTMAQTTIDCASAAAESWPKQATQVFHYRIEGAADLTFKELSLRGFVQNIKDLDRHRVRFDFATMSCPFVVELALNQPYVANDVAQVGNHDPNRIPFLAWLRTVELRIPPETERYLVGSTMRVSVPCGSLDLAS